VENLLQIIAMKRLCRDAGIDTEGGGRSKKGAINPLPARQQVRQAREPHRLHRKRQAVISLRPDHKLVYRQAWDNAKTRVAGVHKLMEEIARLAA
jgi:transcription-repair coupling factor (superfamily II helicase)